MAETPVLKESKTNNAISEALKNPEKYLAMLARKSLENPNGCSLWRGAKTESGYGTLLVNGVLVLAHRLSFALANNTHPGNLFVCHTCDTPACVNPEHLWLGTPLDNVADMTAKGRRVKTYPRVPLRGSLNVTSKMTEADVIWARTKRLEEKTTYRELAEILGVDLKCVWLAVTGASWKHIAPSQEIPKRKSGRTASIPER